MEGSFRPMCTGHGGQKRKLLYAPCDTWVEVGQVTLRVDQASGVAMIDHMEIYERHRGRGLAKAMLSDLEKLLQTTAEYDCVRELRLMALEDVTIGPGKLEALYRGCGFQTQGTCTSKYAGCSWYVPPIMSAYMTRLVPMSKVLHPARGAPSRRLSTKARSAGSDRASCSTAPEEQPLCSTAEEPACCSTNKDRLAPLDLPVLVRNLCCRKDLNYPSPQEVRQAFDRAIPQNNVREAVLSLRSTAACRIGRNEPTFSSETSSESKARPAAAAASNAELSTPIDLARPRICWYLTAEPST